MNLHKIHPEAHDAWLYAMGIDVRWRHKSGMSVQADAEAMMVTDFALPEAIAQARYWVIAADVSGSLNGTECYVLAGMLWAINADVRDVVCSIMTQPNHSEEAVRAVPTALPAWPQLNVLNVSSELLASLPAILAQHPNLHILFLGEDAPLATHERLLYLPSIRAMQTDAFQKQRAWLALKPLRMASH